MEVISNINNTLSTKPLGVGLGNFDGLHIGHITLINVLINECKLHDLHSMVYTFTKHPDNILKKKLVTPLLITVEKKAEILNNLPLDYLFYEDFDEPFSKLEPEEFVKDVLVGNLNIKLAVAGFDYTFGYKGRGNADLLKELGEKYNFRVIIIPPIKVNDEIVSSTLIREYLARGDMEKAFYFLGRHYSITGLVESGKRIGSELGFPTANISPEEYLLLPACGVYITKTLLDGKLYKSITNIGTNPTIKTGSTKVNVETYILDFNEDIYQKRIEVFFIKKIRNEKKFNNREELVRQIKSDVLKAKYY
ncbi:MAG: bifunctional riboflavin kinase/FAD synthetase [Firmicutes bacterium]|nr:bifunctional riboflavin kinase/FAD synthetase [Bacillota bacterium]